MHYWSAALTVLLLIVLKVGQLIACKGMVFQLLPLPASRCRVHLNYLWRHFDYVCSECSRGLGEVSLKYDIPVAFGVLTVDNIEQAIERAGTKAGNKGADAAMTALEMVSLLRKF